MREIKFRAWDKDNQKFIHCRLEPHGWYIRDDSRENGELEMWEQYTGLKDKNGQEIYEGDILATQYVGKLIVVEFNEEMYSEGEPHCCSSSVVYGYYFYDTSPESCQVIGNIYENPELLTNQSE